MINTFHDGRGLVANDLGVAVILIGSGTILAWKSKEQDKRILHGRDIENTVTEAAKCYRGMANIRLVHQFDLQDGNVANDRRRDGGNEEEDGGGEEEEGADMVKEAWMLLRQSANSPQRMSHISPVLLIATT